MLSSSRAKIHEPLVTGVSPRPTDQRQRQKLRNTRDSGNAGITATYIRADVHEVAAALAALTGEVHPLASPAVP
jgi:hypothetical protein